MIKVKALKCPFCGNEDIEAYESNDIYEKSGWVTKYNIGCPECGVWYDYLFDTVEEAVAQWDKRERVISLSGNATYIESVGELHE